MDTISTNDTYLLHSLQEMFEKRRRRRESHNAVERRRRDNINEKIQGTYVEMMTMKWITHSLFRVRIITPRSLD